MRPPDRGGRPGTFWGIALPLELFLLSAAICAPLAGWLAARRRRAVLLWALFGALIGPIALILLFLAPPGTCPVCGEGMRGWSTVCPRCGVDADDPLYPGLTPLGHLETQPASDAALLEPLSFGAVARLRAVTPEVMPVALPTPPVSLGPQPRRRTRREGRRRASERANASAATVVATGVFVSGTQGLEVGGRYAIGVLDDQVTLIGPLDRSPDTIAWRRHRAGIRATVVEHNLVLSAGPPDRPDVALGFRAVAVWSGVDLEAIFPAANVRAGA